MARKVIWTPRAAVLVEEAAQYLRVESPAAAAKLVEEALGAAESLSAFPERGRMVPELTRSKYREIFVGRYRLVYRVAADHVFIVAFVHGARDFRPWWRRYRGSPPN